MVLVIFPVKGDEGLTHAKLDEIQTEIDFFLGFTGEFPRENITAFFIVASLVDGYILIVSTDVIVTSYFFNTVSSSVSFRSDTWTMELRE